MPSLFTRSESFFLPHYQSPVVSSLKTLTKFHKPSLAFKWYSTAVQFLLNTAFISLYVEGIQ